MKLRFLIAAPAYSHHSCGVMALHNLCDMLNRQGYEAAIIFFGRDGPASWQFVCSNDPSLYHPDLKRVQLSLDDPVKAIQDFLSHGVVIYPEVITDNPLGASRIVRYILVHTENFKSPPPNEYILSYLRGFRNTANSVLTQSLTDLNFHSQGAPHWSKRTMDLTYFGKGPDFIECFKIPETVILPRHWPTDKSQLSILLRQCRYFFTWDSVSGTNYDALLCGAVPIFLHERQVSKELRNKAELGAFPDAELVDFNDKESVRGNLSGIDRVMLETRTKFQTIKDSWPENVIDFTIQVHNFFNVKYER